MSDVFNHDEGAASGQTTDGGAEILENLRRAVDNVAEALETARALSALARQLRVLASNASIEAANLPAAPALGEIAHRMRTLSEQASELNATLASALQVQALTLDELRESLRVWHAQPAAARQLGWSLSATPL